MYISYFVVSFLYSDRAFGWAGRYNFTSSSWLQVNAAGRVPRARYRATCVVHAGCMYLFGGHDGTRHLNDVHVFDFEVGEGGRGRGEGGGGEGREEGMSIRLR